MEKRIFVSSTFSDLTDYRKSVREAIRQLGAIDVSMEHFGAREERPKAECLRLIKEESDIFVGIYAHRYGFIPEGDDISITEAEYEEATSAGLPRLIYILDDSTPWIPALVDRGGAGERVQALKAKLKTNHICAFFANPDALATKVAADLGRHFSRRSTVTMEMSNYHLEPEREERLIQELRSADKFRVERSIRALAPSQNPWLVEALRQFVLGIDKDIAEVSIAVLREIPGRSSAKAISFGLSSPLWRVRSLAAFTLGEMALFRRREDAETVIDTLIAASRNPAEHGGILDEIVHSIGKIGGTKAFDALINVLESDSYPTFLKAKALHAPGRFWGSFDSRSRYEPNLLDRFICHAVPIIQQWPLEICKGVTDSSIFEYIRGPLKDAVVARVEAK